MSFTLILSSRLLIKRLKCSRTLFCFCKMLHNKLKKVYIQLKQDLITRQNPKRVPTDNHLVVTVIILARLQKYRALQVSTSIYRQYVPGNQMTEDLILYKSHRLGFGLNGSLIHWKREENIYTASMYIL